MDQGLGDDERRAVSRVETLGKITGELKVLALVLTDRHTRRPIDENVRRLEHGVGEEPDGRAIGALPLRLVLELSHARSLTKPGEAFQNPCELCVLRHVTLYKDC